MIEFVALVLALSLFLYALLAGADFGAGILEILPIGIPTKDKTRDVGKAIGPVWEANHIWLILALVISFNGFPRIFWFLSEYFHFPLGFLVIGIIFRGASFTFMHYDPIHDKSQSVYHAFFGLSSLWCTMWLGIMMGSLMLGDFSLNDQDLYLRYFKHWLNPFAFMMGLFVTLLMVFNAALFLSVETETNKVPWRNVAYKTFLILIGTGFCTHISFYLQNPERWKMFFLNPLSLIFVLVSLLLLVPQIISIRASLRNTSRALAALQLMCIMAAGFAPMFPKIIVTRDAMVIDIYTAAAEMPVIRALVQALIWGSLLIFPGLFFLMRIFKSEKRDRPSVD